VFVPGVLDAWEISGDAVSRVYAYDVNATTGIADTLGLTTYFVVTPVPELAVSLQSSNLLFRWFRGPVEFTLQQSSVLGSGASWHPAGGTVATNGAYNAATLPLDPEAAARFFRLVSQSPTAGAAGPQPNNGPTALPNQGR
jgi:hypothetical protein